MTLHPDQLAYLKDYLKCRQSLNLNLVQGNAAALDQLLRQKTASAQPHKAQCQCPLGQGPRVREYGPTPARVLMIAPPPSPGQGHLEPLTNPARLLLSRMAKSAGLDLTTDIHLTSCPKCPLPQAEPVTEEVAACCLAILREQIEKVTPQIIITLGPIPFTTMLQLNQDFAAYAAQPRQYQGLCLWPLWDPEFLLTHPEYKAANYAALKSIKKVL